MTSSLTPDIIDEINVRLQAANTLFNTAHPGESPERQPVHTVYGGAHIFQAGSAKKMGTAALNHLKAYAPNFVDFAKSLELKGHEHLPDSKEGISALEDQLEKDPDAVQKSSEAAFFAYTVYQRVLEKLVREPVEDFRIDFEDGYGNRPDKEEDMHAVSAADEVANGMIENSLPPFIGIRIKPLTEEQKNRALVVLAEADVPKAMADDFDYVFIDGTFYSEKELPNRDLSGVPHPLVKTSAAFLTGDFRAKVTFIHLNHSNPLWDENSAASMELRRQGLSVAKRGNRFPL